MDRCPVHVSRSIKAYLYGMCFGVLFQNINRVFDGTYFNIICYRDSTAGNDTVDQWTGL